MNFSTSFFVCNRDCHRPGCYGRGRAAVRTETARSSAPSDHTRPAHEVTSAASPCSFEQLKQCGELHQEPPGPLPSVSVRSTQTPSTHPPSRALLISRPNPTGQGLSPQQLGHFASCLSPAIHSACGPFCSLSLARTGKQVSVLGERSLTQFPQAIC